MSLSIRPYPTLETTQDLNFKLGIQTYISLALNTDQKWTLTCFHVFYQNYDENLQKLGTFRKKIRVMIKSK